MVDVKQHWETEGVRFELEFWDKTFAAVVDPARESDPMLSRNRDFVPRVRERLKQTDWSLPRFCEDRIRRSAAASKPRLRVLDAGAGPLSVIGDQSESFAIDLVAVDALAEQYNALFEKHGLQPRHKTSKGLFESLSEQFGPCSFDFVFSQNALDHCIDAYKALVELVDVARPGSCVVVLVFEKEGSNARFTGFHQWDFFLADGRVYLGNRSGMIRDIQSIIGERGRVIEAVNFDYDKLWQNNELAPYRGDDRNRWLMFTVRRAGDRSMPDRETTPRPARENAGRPV